MTSSTQDRLLREVLAHEADRHDVPAFDPDSVVAGARARRRRRRALAGGSAVAVAAVAGVLAFSAGWLGVDETALDVVPQGGLHRVPGQVDPSAPRVPWCGWRPSDHGGDVLHVGGAAFATPCTYWNTGHRYLFYHAGRLVMSSPGTGIEVFLGDRFVKLSDSVQSDLRISLDGRYLAWFEDDALVIQDLDAGVRVARAVVPDELSGPTTPATLEGLDAERRAYTLVEGGVVWVLDGARWTRVRGLPQQWIRSGNPEFSYVTPDGFAVPVRGGSVEGRVTRDGEFEPVRTVPLGRAVWSPDRSHVVQLAREGFTAHSALDLRTTVPLDVPVDPTDVPQVAWDAQWESESTVLLTWAVTEGPNGEVDPATFVIHRCSALTGDCRVLPEGISLPSSAGNHPGG